MNFATKNWKTTLIGVGGAIAMGGGQLISAGIFDWKVYIQMAFMAALGIVAKDSNVTGGTVQQ
jgi:hypothetical protein